MRGTGCCLHLKYMETSITFTKKHVLFIFLKALKVYLLFANF